MAVKWLCAGDLVVMEAVVVGLREKDGGRGPWSVEVEWRRLGLGLAGVGDGVEGGRGVKFRR